MLIRPWTPVASQWIVIPRDDIDTDQIIPARFLTTTRRDGLGTHAFHDWRYRADGSTDPAFPLNRPEARGARILVAGHNFGCGSSREHAVWALLGAGIGAVVSTGFADIFRGNALGNGLLPVQVASTVVESLMNPARFAPDALLAIDLETQALTLPDGSSVRFPVPPFARHCLLNGVDELEFLLGAEGDIDAFELARVPPGSLSAR
ncbi:MAG TPA: 3-isopropylmalate dehydratase small subunit [Gemmatimonadaceae bacterium]|nr:3-isopropylmalate dehydratase small subunit [Gemmatimonadaceae bacterium]